MTAAAGGATSQPLAFLVSPGSDTVADGPITIRLEARMLSGHRKEAVVQEGEGGPAWRLESDEGLALKGTDLAPFPLGYFNAGIHGELHGRVARIAAAHGIDDPSIATFVRNPYGLRGSFARGDGAADAGPSEITLRLDRATAAIPDLVGELVRTSPALAALSTPLTNTFALTVNGRRQPLDGLAPSPNTNVADPFLAWADAPRPAARHSGLSLIRKTGTVVSGDVVPAAASIQGRIVRTVAGTARVLDMAGLSETVTVLEQPGSSHFALVADDRARGHAAPRGLSLLSAGVAFCLLTQLSRYVKTMRLDVRGLRLVQQMGFGAAGCGGAGQAHPAPVDTHVFLNAGAGPEVAQNLLRMAAHTCFLHAALGAALPPRLRLETATDRR